VKAQVPAKKKERRDWKEQLLYVKDAILLDDQHRATALVPVVTTPGPGQSSQKKWQMQWNRWCVLFTTAIVVGVVLIVTYFVSQYEQIKAVSQ
jgi:hypothetical protein